MTDKEFRSTVERWVAANKVATVAKNNFMYLGNQREAAKKYPHAIESLDEVGVVQAQIDVLNRAFNEAGFTLSMREAEAAQLNAQIRATLPEGVWYRVGDQAVMWQSKTTQVMNWKDVQAQVAQ